MTAPDEGGTKNMQYIALIAVRVLIHNEKEATSSSTRSMSPTCLEHCECSVDRDEGVEQHASGVGSFAVVSGVCRNTFAACRCNFMQM